MKPLLINLLMMIILIISLTGFNISEARAQRSSRSDRSSDDSSRRDYSGRGYTERGGSKERFFGPTYFSRYGGRFEFRRSEDSDQNKPSSESQKESDKPKEPVRVTADLPERFTTLDTDKDGQIGFYEWRQANPELVADFHHYDHNTDGFLTPKELLRGKLETNAQAVSHMAADSNTTPPAQSYPAAEKGANNANERPASRLSQRSTDARLDEDHPLVKKGRHYFGLMDRDGNKTLSRNEWMRSRRLRPVFERDGIDLKKPMNSDTFVANFIRLFPNG